MVRERNNNSPLEKVRKTIQAPASDHFVGNLSLTVPKGERFGFNRTKLDAIIGILGEDNFVYRFRILIQRDGVRTNFSEDLRVNVIYLENDSIDCRLYVNLGKVYESDLAIIRGSSSSSLGSLIRHRLYEDQSTMTNFALYESPKIKDMYYDYLATRLTLKFRVTPLRHIIKPSMKRSLAFRFNQESSSDFEVKCSDKTFHVQSSILAQHSDVLAAFLRSDCQESRTKEITIEDFKPKTVEAFLKFMYIEAVQTVDIDICLLQMSDKYNVTSLFEICDQFLANQINLETDICDISEFMTIAEMLKVPKITAKLIKWKKLDRGHDYFWTGFVAKNASFAQMVANIIGTEHNAIWRRDDRSSNITFSQTSKNVVVM